MVVLGIVALIQIARGSANLGIDFAGGTAVQLKFDQAIRIDEARKALEANGLGNAELQEFGQENKLLIRSKDLDDHRGKGCRSGRGGLYEGIFLEPFRDRFQHGNRTDHRAETSSKMPSLRSSFPLPGSFCYVAARFELRFGIAAALATFHDVLAVLGAFYILDKEITLARRDGIADVSRLFNDGYGRRV